jgi:hypothetical protein
MRRGKGRRCKKGAKIKEEKPAGCQLSSRNMFARRQP